MLTTDSNDGFLHRSCTSTVKMSSLPIIRKEILKKEWNESNTVKAQGPGLLITAVELVSMQKTEFPPRPAAGLLPSWHD